MPVHSRRDYQAEAAREPFQLELQDGTKATFIDPQERPTEESYSPELDEITDPKDILRYFLGDDFDRAWAELKTWPTRETNALLQDVQEYYTGATKSAAE